MIGLDTNVLVRLLVEDDDAQVARARAFVGAAVDRGEDLYVGDVVLCELVWVLERAYRFERAAIVTALRGLRGPRHVVLASSARVDRAIAHYAAGTGDFADHLLHAHATDAGCDAVVTFDAALHALPGWRAP